MGYRGQGSGSRRGAGQKFQRTKHEKTKAKAHRSKANKKQMLEDAPIASLSELAEKTVAGLGKLGTQTFALSPFSQYYDDWLVNLRQVVSEFESDAAVAADETFGKEREKIFTDVERALALIRLKEAALEDMAKTLSDTNHQLGDADAEYAHGVHELSAKRNAEISRLTKKVHDLEAELDSVKHTKTSLFGFTKKVKAKKEEETNRLLGGAKTALEVAVQNFNVEQEKQHDTYEKKKQDLTVRIRDLEKELAGIETDPSVETRQSGCNALAAAVKVVMQKKHVEA